MDMEPFFDNYKKVLPYFINDCRCPRTEGTAAIPRTARPLRRIHQVHPVRGLHHLLPVVLGQRRVSRSRRAGDRAPLHLRQPRRRRLRAPADRERNERTARCHTVYNCTMACPRDIQITKAIGELKMAMVTGKLD